MKLSGHLLCCTAIFLQCSTCGLSQSMIDETIRINQSEGKKYQKKLRKEEGAIRLVGGSNDYEG